MLQVVTGQPGHFPHTLPLITVGPLDTSLGLKYINLKQDLNHIQRHAVSQHQACQNSRNIWTTPSRPWCGPCGCPVQDQELDSVIPVGPFQLRILSDSLVFQNQFTINLHLLRKPKSSSAPAPPNYFFKWQKLGKHNIFHLEEVSAAYLCLKVIDLYLFLCIAGCLRAKAAQQGKEKLCCLQQALNSLCIFIISIFMHPFTKLNRSYCLVIYNPENHLISKGQHRV